MHNLNKKNIMIKSLSMSPLGPVKKELHLKFSLFNCIYSGNEGGKTTIIEFIIHTLFNREATWTIRDYIKQATGSICMDICESDDIILRPKKSESMMDYISEIDKSIKLDRLLLTRGGVSDIHTGVDGDNTFSRKNLRSILSNKHILDKINNAVPVTIQNCSVDNEKKIITGDNRGSEISNYNNLVNQRAELQKKISQFENIDFTSFRQKCDELDNDIDYYNAIIEAKKFEAYKTSIKIEEIQNEESNYNDQVIKELNEKIPVYNSKIEELDKKKELCNNNAKKLESLSILPVLDRKYNELKKKGGLLWIDTLSLLMAFLIIMIVSFSLFFKMNTTFASNIIITGITSFLLLCIILLQKFKGRSIFRNYEYKTLIKHFSDISDKPFTPHLLDKYLEQYKNLHYTVSMLKKDITQYENEIKVYAYDIKKLFDRFPSKNRKAEDTRSFRDRIAFLTNYKNKLTRTKEDYVNNLNRLNIDKNDYIYKPNSVTYSEDEERRIAQKIEKLKLEKTEFEKKYLALFSKSSIDFSRIKGILELYTYLIEQKKETENLLRHTTARIIAGKMVHRMYKNVIANEDTIIDKILKNEDFTSTLQNLSQRYRSISFEKEKILVSNIQDEFYLSDLSSGAYEQVMLSFRVSLLRNVFKGGMPFIILDDALQHSDYQRRVKLVDELYKLSQEGLQIIYFTMDDHIKSLFKSKNNVKIHII